MSEYSKIWKNHVETLSSLKWNLDTSDFNQLVNVQIILNKLIEKADKNRIKKDGK